MENVQGTYKLTRKSIRFSLIVGICCILMSSLPYIFLIKSELWEAIPYVSIFLVPFFCLGLLIIANAVYYKIILTDSVIALKVPFGNRSFSFNEITGYRTSILYIYIYSDKEKMAISTSTKDFAKLYSWILENCEDLDQVLEENSFAQKLDRFLANHFPDLGFNEEKEEESTVNFNENDTTFSKSYKRKVKIAKYITFAYCLLVCLITVLLCIYPLIEHLPFLPNYNSIFLSAVLIVPIGIIIPKISNGFIVHSYREKNKPNITKILFVPWVGLLLLSSFINTLDSNLVWLYSYGIGISLTLLVLLAKEFNFKQLQTYFYAAFFLFCFTAYGHGIVVLGNSFYDKPTAKAYKAKITKKTNYSNIPKLRLDKWHETYEVNNIEVSAERYNQLEKNDSITIYVKEGKFGIPWFILR